MGGDSNRRREWQCSGWNPGATEVQPGFVDRMGRMWEQKAAEEDFAEGTKHER